MDHDIESMNINYNVIKLIFILLYFASKRQDNTSLSAIFLYIFGVCIMGEKLWNNIIIYL